MHVCCFSAHCAALGSVRPRQLPLRYRSQCASSCADRLLKTVPVATRWTEPRVCLKRTLATSSFAPEREEQATSSIDVSGVVINPAYRSVPWKDVSTDDSRKLRILILGESNTCRSVIAEVILNRLILENNLQDMLECESKASRDYQLGCGPGETTLLAAQRVDLAVPADSSAKLFDAERDVVAFDLLLVMDKFVAADVMRDVAGYDLINPGGNYSCKVRRLGEFHPELAKNKHPDGQDIDDPLYGNLGGEEEIESVQEAIHLVEESCKGLLQYLKEVQDGKDVAAFRAAFAEKLQSLEQVHWLVPPLLSPRQSIEPFV